MRCSPNEYTLATYTLSERHIYGSSRLGMETTPLELLALPPAAASASATYSSDADRRLYELTNHLGNVLATFTARKLPIETDGAITGFSAHVTSMTDYYPFGSALTGRMVENGYRYGFNAMEREDDIYSPASVYDFGARMYDGRLGRWWSVDPDFQLFSGESVYLFSGGNPVYFLDPDGRTKYPYLIVNDHVNNRTIQIKLENTEEMKAQAVEVVQGDLNGVGGQKETSYDWYDFVEVITVDLYEDSYTVSVDVELVSGPKTRTAIKSQTWARMKDGKYGGIMFTSKPTVAQGLTIEKRAYSDVIVMSVDDLLGVLNAASASRGSSGTSAWSTFLKYMKNGVEVITDAISLIPENGVKPETKEVFECAAESCNGQVFPETERHKHSQPGEKFEVEEVE